MRRRWKITITVVALLVAALMVFSIVRFSKPPTNRAAVKPLGASKQVSSPARITKLQTQDQPPDQEYSNPNAVAGMEGPAKLAKNGERRPPTDFELLGGALHKLQKGVLVDRTPERMKTGQTVQVVARIGSDKLSLDKLQRDMPSGENQKVEVEKTPISPKMKMTLKGADFDITPLSSEEQIVVEDAPTTWVWDISPKHGGTLRLHLAAIVEVNDLSKDLTAIDREVIVQVDPINEAETIARANVPWVVSGVLAVLGGIWKLISMFRKKGTEAVTPDPGTTESNSTP